MRAIRQLLRRSLLRRWLGGTGDGSNVEIHPLVGEVVTRHLTSDQAYRCRACRRRTSPASARQRRRTFNVTFPKVRIRGQARYKSERSNSASSVWLAIWVGRFESARGAFALARTAEKRALTVGRQVLGEEYPGTCLCIQEAGCNAQPKVTSLEHKRYKKSSQSYSKIPGRG